MDLELLVKTKLNGHSKCAGHCEESTELKLLHREGMLLGCYRCPSGYVSLIVQYGEELDLPAFKTFLSSLQENVTDEDIRIGTRYAWDMGIECESSDPVLREAYWRQSYRRTKNDDPSRLALFQCSKCDSFYSTRISNRNRLCAQCS